MVATRNLARNVAVKAACGALGIPRASFYRWRRPRGESLKPRPAPPRTLSTEERCRVRDILNSEEFLDKAPPQVYAALLDQGTYMCSVRTMYRILKENGEVKERRNQLRHPQYHKPELLATGANQVWSWDITKLRGSVKWSYFHLYVILDIFSRYVVGWLLADKEDAALAKLLIEESIAKQGICKDKLTLHADRGGAMRSKPVAQLLAELGVTKSHSRPHVSNDNPFSESQFKTLKYRPDFPQRFGSIEDGRSFCRNFFRWYNKEHYHSGIGFMTPASVHYGEDRKIQDRRHETLLQAYRTTPERFTKRPPVPPSRPQAVWINPPSPSEEDLLVQASATNSTKETPSPADFLPADAEFAEPLELVSGASE